MQLDRLSQPRLHLLETLQRFIERNHIDALSLRQGVLRDGLPDARSAVDACPRLRMVYEHTPHQPRGQREEVSAIVQGNVGLDETQECLVYHGGGLERMTSAPPFHVVLR